MKSLTEKVIASAGWAAWLAIVFIEAILTAIVAAEANPGFWGEVTHYFAHFIHFALLVGLIIFTLALTFFTVEVAFE